MVRWRLLTVCLVGVLINGTVTSVVNGSRVMNGSTNRLRLSEQPECKSDLATICDKDILYNNFAVLECVQNAKIKYSDLSSRCHHFIWTYKRNLTTDDRFLDAAKQVCSAEILNFTECKPTSGASGQLLSCLMDKLDNRQDNKPDNSINAECRHFLNKMENIIFSDYRLIYKFTEACDGDITRLLCGRLDFGDETPHSQGETIACLQRSVRKLSTDCRFQILRISELQSEDFHLDRPLYFACRDDRERFCSGAKAGEGRIYRCLMNHKLEIDMSNACKERLTQRQALINEDFRVSKGLARACREEIRDHKCREETSKNREIRLAQILLCLENAMHDGSPISGECRVEMLDHRRALLEDFSLSPDVVNSCRDDISRFCNERLESSSRTLHCLMDHARPTTRKKNRLTENCKRELQKLIRETDAGEDWRVDPVLKEACQPVVDLVCKGIRAGEGRVLSCLMDKLGSDRMTEECEDRLLQIQYFIARDFRLDPKLYHNCREDAHTQCHASTRWAEEPGKAGPETGPLLPCLYRYTFHPEEDKKLSPACMQEVKRVMRQRAVSVDLHPDIEAKCVKDLAEFCLEKVKKGEELNCLQENLEKISPSCRTAVGNFTVEESEHSELNTVLYRACEPLAKKYCEDILGKDDDQGDLLQCLLSHKNDYETRNNEKCRTALEHFQLISLKDYRFSYKFKEACKKDVMKYCKAVKTKNEVVSCLSEMARNDTLLGKQQRVSPICRQQLRVELLQRNEDILLDPKLAKVCEEDRLHFCSTLTPGNARILECLKDHRVQLSAGCRARLFQRQEQDMADTSTDFLLTTTCKKMIKTYCMDAQPENVLQCLKENKNELEFDSKCRSVVLKRMAQQNIDYRLNPSLRKSCRPEIQKFCSVIIENNRDEISLEGSVIECLKKKFRTNGLRTECEDEISRIIQEAQLDYHQDPVLNKLCQDEIKQCVNELGDNDGHGGVEECLKGKFQGNRIADPKCSQQVARLIEEAQADIHVDPILYKACVLDLQQHCSSVPPGEGRQMQCLLSILDSNERLLTLKCKNTLAQRKRLFETAAKVIAAPLESVQDVINEVSVSPNRNYFIVVLLAAIGSIFIGGLFCGRVTKRVAHTMKTK